MSVQQRGPAPCPFCGGSNIRVHIYADVPIGGEPDGFAQCHDCSTTGPNAKTESDAIAAWNRRAAAPPPPVLPLSEGQIDKIRESLVEKMLATGMLVGDDAWDNSLARAIERAHGITKPGAGGESGA